MNEALREKSCLRPTKLDEFFFLSGVILFLVDLLQSSQRLVNLNLILAPVPILFIGISKPAPMLFIGDKRREKIWLNSIIFL